jgi:hypothetical protein
MLTVSVCPVINVTGGQDIWKHRRVVWNDMYVIGSLGGVFSLMSVLLQTCLITIMTCFCNVLAHSDRIHEQYLSTYLGRMKQYSQIPIECLCHHHSINAACIFIHTFIHLPSVPYNLSSWQSLNNSHTCQCYVFSECKIVKKVQLHINWSGHCRILPSQQCWRFIDLKLLW